MAMTDALGGLDDAAVWITAVVAGCGAVGYAVRKVWRFTRKLDRLLGLINHELNPNHGTSLVDKVNQIAASVNEQGADLFEVVGSVSSLKQSHGELVSRFDHHLSVIAEANLAMWPAIEEVARSEPSKHHHDDATPAEHE